MVGECSRNDEKITIYKIYLKNLGGRDQLADKT
jgi:hypothetical protein